MNLIFYDKTPIAEREIIEYLKTNTEMNVLAAYSKEDVIKLFGNHQKIDKLVLVNIALPSDLGLIKYVVDNYPGTRIIVYATSVIKESIEIIKSSEITVLNNDIDNLKKMHELLLKG